MDTIGGYYWWWNHIEIPAGFKLGSSECWSDALTNWATGALALELDTAQFQDGSLWCRLYSAWWMLKQLTVLSTKVFLLQPQQAGYQQSLFMCHQNPIKGWNKVFFACLKLKLWDVFLESYLVVKNDIGLGLQQKVAQYSTWEVALMMGMVLNCMRLISNA